MSFTVSELFANFFRKPDEAEIMRTKAAANASLRDVYDKMAETPLINSLLMMYMKACGWNRSNELAWRWLVHGRVAVTTKTHQLIDIMSSYYRASNNTLYVFSGNKCTKYKKGEWVGCDNGITGSGGVNDPRSILHPVMRVYDIMQTGDQYANLLSKDDYTILTRQLIDGLGIPVTMLPNNADRVYDSMDEFIEDKRAEWAFDRMCTRLKTGYNTLMTRIYG